MKVLLKNLLIEQEELLEVLRLEVFLIHMIYFPKCCSPIPGDEIIGYITRGKGVTIHRNNCTNVKFEKVKDRFIEVEWEVNKESSLS